VSSVRRTIKGRDILSLKDYTSSDIEKILDVSATLKAEVKRGHLRKPLENKGMAMLFQKPSTRTRVSFDMAMFQLGGHALDLTTSKLQVGRGETMRDTGANLSRYVDVIMARLYNHEDIESLADGATVPIINGLTDKYHPCQILGDLLTLREKKGGLKGLKVAYVGDGTNVANSLLVGLSKCGIDISVATPNGYEPLKEAIEEAKRASKKTSCKVEVTNDKDQAAADADAVYTDTWVSMGMEKEKEQRMKVFKPYQVDSQLMKKAKPDAVFMHCLPMHRGLEVSSKVADGPQSIIFDQAENRLHAQKGILVLLLTNEFTD